MFKVTKVNNEHTKNGLKLAKMKPEKPSERRPAQRDVPSSKKNTESYAGKTTGCNTGRTPVEELEVILVAISVAKNTRGNTANNTGSISGNNT